MTSGVSLQTFLDRGGLAEEQLDNTWFSVEEFDRLMNLAVELTGEPALGLKWTQNAPMMQYDLLPLLVFQATSLEAAIKTILRYQVMLADRPEVEFIDKGGSALLRCSPLAVSEVGLRVRSEMIVLAMVRLLSVVGGSAHTVVKRVSFMHAPPPHLAEYEDVFQGLARFNQPFYGVEFEYRQLDGLQAPRAPSLAVPSSSPERVQTRAGDEQTYVQQLQAYMLRTFPAVPDMTEAARSLGMSERSLRRRLADEGHSFSQLVEQTQIELAGKKLKEPGRSIKEVAHVLGFASASGFHRAFKRWTGISPAQYRARR